LHRDLKPQNLLLNHRGELKLADFGLALETRGNVRVRGGIGTPAFMAPELWSDGTPSAASDIYGLGACLYFTLTGRVPFPFGSLDKLERAHRELEPKLPAEIPTGIRQAVLAMMAKDPASRPGSAGQLARELSALARDPSWRLHAGRSSGPPAAANPMIARGPEHGLEATWCRGPDRIHLERLLELLQGKRSAIRLQGHAPGDGKTLLRLALARLEPSPRIALRLELPGPSNLLQTALRQRTSCPPNASLERVCAQLASAPAAVANTLSLVEIHIASPLSPPQAAELAEFVAVASSREIITILLETSDGTTSDADMLPAFELLRLPAAAHDRCDFQERVKLWLGAATAERWSISADGMRVLRHACEQGATWRQLLQNSLLISAAAHLPVITSWAVQSAQTSVGPLHDVSDVPAEFRAPPRRWPSPKTFALLAELRTAEGPPNLQRQPDLTSLERMHTHVQDDSN
jgi:hypothetical protein